MTRKTLLVLLPVGLVCGLLVASQTITLKDGQKFTGDVSKTSGGYQVRLMGGDTIVYASDKVKSVAMAPDMRTEYQNRLSKIDADKADGHIKIGIWAKDAGCLDIAYVEFAKALAIDPENEIAKVRLNQVTEMLDDLAKVGTKVIGAPTTKESEDVIQGATGGLVSNDDIYRIRIFEVKNRELREGAIQIDFRNKVLDKFIEQMRGQEPFTTQDAERQFRALPKSQQLLVIREKLGSVVPGITDDIQIKTDPKFMKDFRRDVWPQVVLSCGQAQCHGAPNGKGGFKLFNMPGRNDRADYTNFLIISLWNKGGNTVIDRRNTDDSLLLQYGLPQNLAGTQHPKEITPLYKDTNAPNYRKIREWIKSLEGAAQPDYGTKYQPPVGRKLGSDGATFLNQDGPATAPSSKPAGDDTKDPFNK